MNDLHILNWFQVTWRVLHQEMFRVRQQRMRRMFRTRQISGGSKETKNEHNGQRTVQEMHHEVISIWVKGLLVKVRLG